MLSANAARLALQKSTPEHTDDGAAFEERQIERNLRDLPGGKANDEQPPAPGDERSAGSV